MAEPANEPGRVLQVHNRYRQSGGEDSVVTSLTAALSKHGWRAESLLVDNPNGPATLGALPRAIWNRASAAALTERMRAFNPDVTHVHNTWFALTPSVVDAAHSHGPVVMTLHNFRLTCANATLYRAGDVCERCVTGNPWTGFWLNCYRDPISSAIAAANVSIHRRRGTWNSNVDRFFALSSFARDVFVRAGIDPSRIEVTNNFVADPGPRPSPPSESDYVLYVGRLAGEKGIAELADRWARFGPTSLRLVICGDGPLRPQLTEAPGIVVRGWSSPQEVVDLMMNARTLIFPSRWYEGQPLTILEAFASGLPVIGTRLGAVAELLGFLGPEWLADRDDDDEWQAVFELAASGIVDEASVAVRGRYLANHTESAVVRLVSEGYRQAIKAYSV